MALVSFARSSIARLALLHGVLLAASMMAVLGGVYLGTSRLIAAEGDQLITLEAQGLAADFRERDLDAFVTTVVDRADDPWVRGGVYELRGPSGDFLAGNVVVLPDLAVQPGGWAEFDVAVTRGDANASRRIRAKVQELGGGFRLLVGHDVQDRRAFRDVMLRSLAWAVLVTLLFGALGGWWLGRRLSRTAQAISASAGRIAAGNLGERLPVSGSGDEIDALVSRFNELLGRVESLTTTMRAVLDSTAHDLRGHLNRIRGAAQDARKASASAPQAAATDAVLAEIDRLSETLQGLLRIALAESGTAPLEDFNLSAAALDLAEFYQPVAEPGQLTVDVEAGLVVRGHRQLLAQALSNLLDNALKYGGGTPVSLRLHRCGARARLEVADGGPGIPAEHREHATQRFRRLPGSSGLPGSGLGLSLVAAVARLHHGELELADAGPGLRVVLDMPLAAGPAAA
ncbi:MAG TPA: HAMP domain-containing sensor histidine kinase [Steroidobacteraceae bacterium]|nr:HAMP domain-containing sensor histidine kinase [Steroidobacteraceae bacterium]